MRFRGRRSGTSSLGLLWTRRLIVASFCALTLVAGSRAWACVPQPNVLVQPRSSGPTGTHVQVVGENFGGSPLEVRWNAVDGDLLAKTKGPSFTADVVVPAKASEGLYTLLVVARGTQGEVVDTARAAFQVTGKTASRTSTAASGSRKSAEPDKSSSSSSPIGPMLAGAAIATAAGLAGALTANSRRRNKER